MAMSTAEQVLSHVKGASAYTLAGGYAVHPHPWPRRVFEPARVSEERRNKAGRVSHMIASYADGSRLRFVYHATRGASLTLT